VLYGNGLAEVKRMLLMLLILAVAAALLWLAFGDKRDWRGL